MKRALAALALAVAAALGAATAQASPLVNPSVGGMVFTGPTSAHVSALYWNPAATGLMRGRFRIFLAGQLHADLLRVDRATIDTATGEPSADVTGPARKSFGSVKDSLLTPGGFFGVTTDAGSDVLTAGLAVYTPFFDVQPDGHPELAYHTQGGYLASTYFSGAISYRIASRWIAGAGLSVVFSWARLRFAFDEQLETCAAAPCQVENPATTSSFDITAERWASPAAAFNGGLLWKARDDLWLAFAYHSPPGFDRVSLPARAEVTTSPSPTSGSRLARGDAQINFSLPHIVQLGARWDVVPGRWQLLGSARAAFLSAVNQFDLRLAGPELRSAGVREWILRYRGLQSSLQLEAGLETPAGATTRWAARLRFDTGGADAAHVAPEQITGPSFDLSAGMSYALVGGLSVTVAASAGFILPRHVDDSVFKPSAQTACVASGYDLDHCRGAREGSAIDTAAGDYQRYNFAGMIGLSLDIL